MVGASRSVKRPAMLPRHPAATRVRAHRRPTLITIIYDVLQWALNAYKWIVIIAIVLTNLVSFGVVDRRNRFVWTVGDFLYRITEPALRPIRRMMPNLGGIDLSPIVLFVLIWIAQAVLARLYESLLTGNLSPLVL